MSAMRAANAAFKLRAGCRLWAGRVLIAGHGTRLCKVRFLRIPVIRAARSAGRLSARIT